MKIIGETIGPDGDRVYDVMCRWELKDCVSCEDEVHCCERVWRHYAQQAASSIGGSVSGDPFVVDGVLEAVIVGVPAANVLPPRVEFVEGDEEPEGEETVCE